MPASDVLRAAVSTWGFDPADEAAVVQFFDNRVVDPTFTATPDLLKFYVTQDPSMSAIFDKRFAGNKTLRQAGKQELSYSEYTQAENTYKTVLRNAGLPPGFYDDPQSLANLVGGEVSAQELSDRAQAAYLAVRTENPALRAELQNLYGVNEGELAAYFLDPNKAMDAIGKRLTGQDLLRRAESAQIGAEVRRAAGVGLTAQQAEQLQAQGFTGAEVARQAEQIAANVQLTTAQQAGEQQLSTTEAIQAALGTNPAAAQRIATRQRRRQAAFQQGGGFAQTNQFLQTGLQTVGE